MKARRRLAVLAAAAIGSALTAGALTLGSPGPADPSPAAAALALRDLAAPGTRSATASLDPASATATTTTADSIPAESTPAEPIPVAAEVAATSTKPKPTTTTTKPKPTTTTTTKVPGASAEEQKVLELVNARRAEAGCKPLRWNDKLGTAARKHSADMAANNYFSHTSQDGRSPFDRIRAEGYTKGGGENIAAGQGTPEAVMTSWMNSAGHKANILNCKFGELGVGVAKGGSYRIYWTQTFGYA
ncbi:CAP domain-containing protein [Actinokineospora sp. NBRC 105648]|uniref:CAP domain-containing protein n=1 Tax=Actinokineospora sp. NBRC 105648 TaxID=3032206 RepID=UPI0024A54DF9|nr:CAP domain-containing protein [Actinokineospora sp. NBRC 105648]GLZ41005.1 hypothetical protein Acsp05_46290 [Actinokineospora sp. NBRC 105648]